MEICKSHKECFEKICSLCEDYKPLSSDAVLAEVRAIIDNNSYLINEGSVMERRVCNHFRLMEALKLKFGSEHFI